MQVTHKMLLRWYQRLEEEKTLNEQREQLVDQYRMIAEQKVVDNVFRRLKDNINERR